MKTRFVNRRRSKPRRGAIIILIAFILPVLFVLVGFSIDMANMQRTRTELRASTDLAAKAASETLARTGDTTQAIASGKLIASSNAVAGDGLTLVDTDFTFGNAVRLSNGKWSFTPSATDLNSVKITGARTSASADGAIGMYFGDFFGQSSFEPTVSATAGFLHVDICLVLDRSSSMKKDFSEAGGLPNSDPRACKMPLPSSRWMDLDAAVRVFLNELRSTAGPENIAMVTFGGPMGGLPSCSVTFDASVVSIDQDLTTNITTLENALTARTNSVWVGNTDIAAGINTGISVLANARPNSEKVMVLFTDGQYTEDNPVPLAATASANGIMIHTITFGPSSTDPWITDMQTIATNTGGRHLHAPNSAALIDAFRDIAASISMLIE
jgi:hypothetical protein